MNIVQKTVQWLRGLFAPAIVKGWGKKFVIREIRANNKKGEKRTFYMLPYIVPKLRDNVTALAVKILDEAPTDAVERFRSMTFGHKDIFAIIAMNIQWLVQQNYLSQFVGCILLPEGVSIEEHTREHIAETARFIDLYMPQKAQMEAVVLFFLMLDLPTTLAVLNSIRQTLRMMMDNASGQAKK